MSVGKDKHDGLSTPFDSVFKTECKKLSKYLVPLIKEMFGLDSELVDELPDIMPEEHYALDGTQYGNPAIIKKISDSCIRIGDKYYHVECQSTTDGDLLVRLAEYNVMIGLDNAVYDKKSGVITIRLPQSSLMMLRAGEENNKKFSSMKIYYVYEEQSIVINVPVMNVQSYSVDEIYRKKLYFLIPFYALRYEDAFRKWAVEKLVGGAECDKIYLELSRFFSRLERAYKTKEISENDARNIAEMSQIIIRHLTTGCSDVLKERMVSVMGGQVLELQDDRWLNEGKKEGKVLARFEDGMAISEIAIKSEISEDEVERILEDNGLLQPQK